MKDPGAEHAIREACERADYDAAATRAIKSYGPEILGFLAMRLRDISEAEEVFAIFCEDLWTALRAFEWRATARVWAYTLARHAADRHRIAAARRRKRETLGGALQDVVADVRSTTAAHLRTETKSRLSQLREQLPVADQTLLVLRIDKGLSWKELALVMVYEGVALDEASVTREAARLRKRFQLVKQQLRELARAEGLLDEE